MGEFVLGCGAAARAPSDETRARRELGAVAQRQCEEERAALSSFTLRPDLPPMRLHDPPGDGEPQTGAQPGGLPRLPEALKDMRDLIRSDPGPGVADRERHLAIDELAPDGDRAACRAALA